MEDIILLGCGGHAKSVVDSIEQDSKFKIAGFIDNNMDSSFSYRNYKIVGNDNDLQKIYDSGIRYAFIGIAYMGKGDTRNRLYEKLKKIGFLLPIIIDEAAVVAKDVQIGEGVFIGKNAVINSNAIIGKMAIINTAAIVEHDCRVGEFCHIAVSAVICGSSNIGNSTLIGANATIIQLINIGENCIIGAGSVVRKDVEDNIIIKDNQKKQNLSDWKMMTGDRISRKKHE